MDDLSVGRDLGIGAFFLAVSDIHRRLSDFIHQVVVHRRDEAIRGWRNWIREDPLVHPCRWLRPDLVPPAPFLQCESCLTPGGSGVLSDPARIDEEFRKAWLPYFCRSGQRETSLEEFSFEVDGWLPLLPEVHLPRPMLLMEPRTAQCSLRVSGSLQPRGRWARSGSQQSAGAVEVDLGAGGTREHFACDAVSSGGRQFAGVGDDVEASVRASHVVCDVVSSGNQQLADVAGSAGLRQSSPQVDRGHFDGRAGRHGEEQRAPGGWRALRPLPGALRQVRNFHRCVSENLISLSPSLVPHARCSLHPSFVSQNSSLSHGLGAMNSCGSMHGLCMHDNSLVVHENLWGALGH